MGMELLRQDRNVRIKDFDLGTTFEKNWISEGFSQIYNCTWAMSTKLSEREYYVKCNRCDEDRTPI
jgi:hypothetical protein